MMTLTMQTCYLISHFEINYKSPQLRLIATGEQSWWCKFTFEFASLIVVHMDAAITVAIMRFLLIVDVVLHFMLVYVYMNKTHAGVT